MIFIEQFHRILFYKDFASIVILMMSLFWSIHTLFKILTQIGNNNDLGNYKPVLKFYQYVVADKSYCIPISKVSNII